MTGECVPVCTSKEPLASIRESGGDPCRELWGEPWVGEPLRGDP